MAETHINFLGGSPLNRLSWLRTSTAFLGAVLASPDTRWLLFHSGRPLDRFAGNTKQHSLARLRTQDVQPLLGASPVFGQGSRAGVNAFEENESFVDEKSELISSLQAARLWGPAVVFLGLHEPEDSNTRSALPSSDFSAKADPKLAASNIAGTPYFALDLTNEKQEAIDKVLESVKEDGVVLEFVEPRSAANQVSAFDAAIFSEARSMLDWNTRNKFCPACGSSVYSLWAGWKLACSSLLPWAPATGKEPCPSSKGVHNFSHPRTDPVVIMAIIDETGDKILLGRNKKFPNGFYSTLAGFVEPGESFEDAVKREIWEEAGVRVWGVKYHSGQPWPYPANLMVGFYAFADSSQPIRVDLDNELDDARWYTRPEIQHVLSHPLGARISRHEYKKFDDAVEKDTESKAAAETQQPPAPTHGSGSMDLNAPPPFRVPPQTAIAGVLIRDWAEGRIGQGGWNALKQAQQKGNL